MSLREHRHIECFHIPIYAAGGAQNKLVSDDGTSANKRLTGLAQDHGLPGDFGEVCIQILNSRGLRSGGKMEVSRWFV